MDNLVRCAHNIVRVQGQRAFATPGVELLGARGKTIWDIRLPGVSINVEKSEGGEIVGDSPIVQMMRHVEGHGRERTTRKKVDRVI
jgi:hypothetical protein